MIFLYNLFTASRTVSIMYPQVAHAQSCANHVQHKERLSCATCCVTCHLVGRESSGIKFGIVNIAFISALSYWLNHETSEGGEETRIPGENLWRLASENVTY